MASAGTIAGYVGICMFFHLMQEGLIFLPQTLPQDYAFTFPWPFDEHRVQTSDGTRLHALLFHRGPSKGVVYFLHGNAGNLQNQAGDAGFYLEQGYDFFSIDYRGYGKSPGRITSEAQLYDDADAAYAWLLSRYPENSIFVLAHSIGAAVAAKVASIHRPRCLILTAPYFSIADFARRQYPFLPSFILKYPLRTDLHLRACSLPVILVHGADDVIFPPSNSERLSALIPGNSRLVIIPGEGHDGVLACSPFHDLMSAVLAQIVVNN
jgi:pimeloyl-ACP methyl ester carboxylesterase